MDTRAEPSLLCEEQGRPGDHSQVQARVQTTSKLVVMRQVQGHVGMSTHNQGQDQARCLLGRST